MRHRRVEQLQQPLERGERRRLGVGVAGVEPRLDRLQVPVAEVVEGQVVELVDEVGEVELGEVAARPRAGSARGARGSSAPRSPAAAPPARVAGVHQDQAGGGPELLRELPALLDRALGEGHVLRRGHLHQPVAGRVRAVALDQRERVHPGAEALRHPAAGRRVHERVDDDVLERDVAHQLEPGEDHPVLPEADDVARGRVQVAGVEGAQRPRCRRASRASRTARAPTRTRCRARPRCGVSSAGAALGARGRAPPRRTSSGRPGTARAAAGAPTRSAARCSSRARPRATRPRSGAATRGGSVTRPSRIAASAGCFSSSIEHHHCGEISGSIRFLQRSHERDRVPVGLALLELVALAQPGEDPLLGLVLGEALELGPASAFMRPSGADHGQLGQVVVAADLPVLGVVAGRHLQRAGAEVELDALVGDHRHAALDPRHDHLAADQRPGSARRRGGRRPRRRRGSSPRRAVAIVMCPLPRPAGSGRR